jgi:hypothetical protein
VPRLGSVGPGGRWKYWRRRPAAHRLRSKFLPNFLPTWHDPSPPGLIHHKETSGFGTGIAPLGSAVNRRVVGSSPTRGVRKGPAQRAFSVVRAEVLYGQLVLRSPRSAWHVSCPRPPKRMSFRRIPSRASRWSPPGPPRSTSAPPPARIQSVPKPP